VIQFPNWALVVRRKALGLAMLAGAGLVAAGLLGAMQPAAAQQGFGNFFGYQTQSNTKRRKTRRRTRRSAPDSEAKTQAKVETSGAVYAVISIGDQSISVYDSTGRIAKSGVSTGTRGHRTPTGVFSVIGRRRHHYSNLYGAAPMPWMQRITWSGIAMHAGHVPGYPASHGCIRLPYSFAPKMWRLTEMGSRVIVAPSGTTPNPITHDFLPKPTMHPVADGSEQASRTPVAKIELASMSSPERIPVTTAATSDEMQPEDAAGSPKQLNPIAYAAVLKGQAKADKAAAEKAEKETLKAAQAAGAEARQAVKDVRKAEADLDKANAGIESAEARVADLKAAKAAVADDEKADDKAAKNAAEKLEAAETTLIAARSELSRARGALDEARRREADRSPAAFAAVQSWKDAVAALKAAKTALKEAGRRSEPVSVFVSKKEGRVFIRQDRKEVYDAPVTFRDPDRPIGTHVYIAVDAKPDGSGMRWSAITVPTKEDKESKTAAKEHPVVLPVRKTAEVEPTRLPPLAAAEALDRIELPAGVRARISELLWTGASLIVSDQPRSHEMSEYSDFIVLTR
jgi:lipoprotein-anchoring transpeptidase ErfK/SrfK